MKSCRLFLILLIVVGATSCHHTRSVSDSATIPSARALVPVSVYFHDGSPGFIVDRLGGEDGVRHIVSRLLASKKEAVLFYLPAFGYTISCSEVNTSEVTMPHLKRPNTGLPLARYDRDAYPFSCADGDSAGIARRLTPLEMNRTVAYPHHSMIINLSGMSGITEDNAGLIVLDVVECPEVVSTFRDHNDEAYEVFSIYGQWARSNGVAIDLGATDAGAKAGTED